MHQLKDEKKIRTVKIIILGFDVTKYYILQICTRYPYTFRYEEYLLFNDSTINNI